MKRLGRGVLLICLVGWLTVVSAGSVSGRMVEMVLDGSGSMAGPAAGGGSKIAAATASLTPVQPKGFGWLEMKRADLSGHVVTRADTGEKVANASRVQTVVKLPAGIYNVTVGKVV